MSDINWQDISSVQTQQTSTTVPAATTIAPKTFVTIVTGTTTLQQITPPVSGDHMLCLIFPDAMGAMSTAGNIIVAADPGVNIPVFMVYNSKTGKYYPGAIS